MTGPETISTRWLVGEFAKRFGVEPKTIGEEAPTALLNNAAKAFATFGYPRVPLGAMIDWVAAGSKRAGRPSTSRPTSRSARGSSERCRFNPPSGPRFATASSQGPSSLPIRSR